MTNCHVVFVVKYRKDLFLSDDYVAYVKVILQEIERRYLLKAETIGFDENSVHMLMQAAPRYSPSRVMQIVKSITAREMFQHFPGIKEELWDGEFWSDGGYIGTVGEGPNAEIIRKYVKNQGRQGDQSRLIDFTTQWLK